MGFDAKELEPIHSRVMECLQIIRDLPAASVEREALRNSIYKPLSQVANLILDASYYRGGTAPGSTPTGPGGRGAGSGLPLLDKWKKQMDNPEEPSPLAGDLDLLK